MSSDLVAFLLHRVKIRNAKRQRDNERKRKSRELQRTLLGDDAIRDQSRLEKKQGRTLQQIKQTIQQREDAYRALQVAAAAASARCLRSAYRGKTKRVDTTEINDSQHILKVVDEGNCGKGVVTLRGFETEDEIQIYDGDTVNEDEKDRLIEEGVDTMVALFDDTKATVPVKDRKYLVPVRTKKNVLKFINHGASCCEANCQLRLGAGKTLVLVTTQTIEPVSFLRWDYQLDKSKLQPGNPHYAWFNAYKCKCTKAREYAEIKAAFLAGLT